MREYAPPGLQAAEPGLNGLPETLSAPKPETSQERERSMRAWIKAVNYGRILHFKGQVLALSEVWGLSDNEAVEMALGAPRAFRIEGAFNKGYWAGDAFFSMVSVAPLTPDPRLDGFTSFQIRSPTWSLAKSLERGHPALKEDADCLPFAAPAVIEELVDARRAQEGAAA